MKSKPQAGNRLVSCRIGDKTSDIAAGQNAGCTTILVKTGEAGLEEDAMPVEATFNVDNLLQAVHIIQSM